MNKSILSVGVVALAFWAFASTGPSAPLPAQEKARTYEYGIAEPGLAGLNRLAAQGWEVVTYVNDPQQPYMLIKRPK